MMEQHPIPQQISSYEFKLVGEMTLKQFLKAAAGIILALLINSTKLVFFIKWPLMAVFGLGGLVLAFVPFEERPLETWIKVILKAIYSPTIYTYRKTAPSNWLDVDLSKKVAEEEKAEEEEEKAIIPMKQKSKVAEFIDSLPSISREKEEEVEAEVKAQPMAEIKLKMESEEVGKKETGVEAVTEEDWKTKKADLGLKTQKLGATGKAEFGSIPMPDIPEEPNTIVGMVTDGMGKIVEGAIIEIQDEEGNPTRVFKTNSLGQFKTVTPLVNGRYLVVVEKEGSSFDRVNVDLRGEIVEPVRITAKG